MIVKNERHVLRRCLDSVRGLVDTWVIVDTGSTDGTQALIAEYFAGVPGELFERPWVNFAANRTEAVRLAQGRADYLLLMDADEWLETDAGFRWPPLTADGYNFQMNTATLNYYRTHMIRSAMPWRYEGVLHEYVTCDLPHRMEPMAGVRTLSRQEGARASDPLTYRRDALLLEEAALREPENPRHMFYLAQSYRDCNEPDAAIARYRRRIAMGGWAEEVWYSLYQIGGLLEAKGAPWPETQAAYLEAYAFETERAESLYRIGMHYQAERNFAVSLLYFARGVEIAYPKHHVLFVEREVYRFLLPLEYAVALYWVGRHAEAIAATDRLLEDSTLSEEQVRHLHKNRAFSVEALAKGAGR